MSVSMCMPPLPPRPLPREPSMFAGLSGFAMFENFYSMSMSFSMPADPGFGLGDTVYFPSAPKDGGMVSTVDGAGIAPPMQVDDAGSSPGITTADETTTTTTTGGDGADTTTTDSLNKATASSSSGASTPQTILMVVLVGAAVAVLSAWYVRKNHRSASSNASQMTPASAPLL